MTRKPAERPPDELIFELERAVCDTSLPVPHRFRAGCFLSMALGGVRWHEVQCSTLVKLARDALIFEATREKVAGWTAHRWGAPRCGPSGSDWGKAFFEMWQQLPLPAGCSWLLPATLCPRGARRALSLEFEFSRKAEFNDALSLYRCIIRGPPLNCSVSESQKHALHGLRAWLDTGLRQARFSEDDTTLACHWAKNSAMPRLYDRSAVTSEVAVKLRLMQGYQAGWRQVEEGAVASHFPVAVDGAAPSTASQRDRSGRLEGNRKRKRTGNDDSSKKAKKAKKAKKTKKVKKAETAQQSGQVSGLAPDTAPTRTSNPVDSLSAEEQGLLAFVSEFDSCTAKP